MAERYFEATCQSEISVEDNKGNEKTKKITERFLIPANNISEAEQIMKKNADGLYDEYRITSVKESKIVAVVEKK